MNVSVAAVSLFSLTTVTYRSLVCQTLANASEKLLAARDYEQARARKARAEPRQHTTFSSQPADDITTKSSVMFAYALLTGDKPKKIPKTHIIFF